MPGAMASMAPQNSPARLRETASMLAKSSEGFDARPEQPGQAAGDGVDAGEV